MITCIAIDDEPLALEIIKKFAGKVSSLQLVETFTDPFDAIEFLKHTKVDLIFLDIQMPELNGIQFYRLLKQPPMVIFTTAFSEYAVEGFNLSALDYLLKPIEYSRFAMAVNKAEEYLKPANEVQTKQVDFLFVKSEYQLVKIDFKDVLYFEALDDYIKIVLENSPKPILTLMPMKALVERLPASKFIRVHRSYIVPLGKIENVRNKRIQIGSKHIPVGDGYSKAFFEALNYIQ